MYSSRSRAITRPPHGIVTVVVPDSSLSEADGLRTRLPKLTGISRTAAGVLFSYNYQKRNHNQPGRQLIRTEEDDDSQSDPKLARLIISSLDEMITLQHRSWPVLGCSVCDICDNDSREDSTRN